MLLLLQIILCCLLYLALVKCAVRDSGRNCLYFYPDAYLDEAQKRGIADKTEELRRYVIQVKTGEESGIARRLKNQAIRAEVPIENRPIRSGGAWTKKEYILFPGYVFLDMDFTARNYYRVKEVPGVIRFLGDSKAPSTLSYLEAEWIRILSGNGEPLEPTLVREDGSGGITVISGVLKQLENRVLKWDKRSRKATFEITICGEARQVQLGIEVEGGGELQEAGSDASQDAAQPLLQDAT